jgi:hypothetical protein
VLEGLKVNRINRIDRIAMAAVGIAAMAITLGGCFQSTQPGQGEVFASREEIAAKDDAICQGYGAKPGSPEYINCRGQQDQRRTAWRSRD